MPLLTKPFQTALVPPVPLWARGKQPWSSRAAAPLAFICRDACGYTNFKSFVCDISRAPWNHLPQIPPANLNGTATGGGGSSPFNLLIMEKRRRKGGWGVLKNLGTMDSGNIQSNTRTGLGRRSTSRPFNLLPIDRRGRTT